MPAPNIKSLSVAELLSLRSEIDQLLQSRRSELEDQLAAIGGATAGAKGRRGTRKGTKVPAKYRDADGNTWAGRGVRPRWLSAALKSGKKLEDFLIAGSKSSGGKAKGKSKGRPGRKSAAA